MAHAVVTVEMDSHERVDLSLPLDIPSQALAAAVMQGLGKAASEADVFAFFIKTEHGETRISSSATLGDAGILDGQYLQIRRESAGARPEAPTSSAYLRTESGDTLAIEGASAVIGRRDVKRGVMIEVDLSKYDPNKVVSRRHASIEREGMKYYLTDLGSTNGTRLNGRQVGPQQKTPLQDGDSIEFGRAGARVTFVTKK